ncbi:Serine racemase [Penicillium brevicompactum]|uniref:Serine racemase n=1 Tax=Penicillium brevicompactum TaxID=5074 RepID=A0A9W9RDH8_PENBR|nr:Serine racemase [Penicillium brevicompactum]
MAHISTCPPLVRGSVIQAHTLIRPYIHRTPVLTSRTLDQLASTPQELPLLTNPQRASPVIRLFFKCENQQVIGAFKARGAFHAIERLKQEPGWQENGGKENGVVAFSAGNHAQAIAIAGRDNGMPVHIVMPNTSRASKVASTKSYGANVVLSGPTDREVIANQIAAETGARVIPPYDHPDVILGQGTVGLELQEQVEDLDAIISPCSGGGLLSGVAISCEGTGVKVFGAEPELDGADDGRRGFLSGKCVTHVKTSTIADGLIGVVGYYPWSVIYERGLVSGMFAVPEENIRDAMRLLVERMKIWVEPSAAVPLAVALYNEEFRKMVQEEAGVKGWSICIVLSGGNIDIGSFSKVFH